MTKRFEDVLNLFSLAAIQGGNALIPLLLFPFLLVTIGAEKFATIATMEAAVYIVLTLTLYSFDVSGLKKIIESRRKGVIHTAKIYYAILYSRLLIFIVGSIILLAIILLIKPSLVGIALIWLLFPLGMALQSSYYYQATGNNAPLAIFVVLPRLVSCGLGFTLIKQDSGVELVSALISLSYLFSGFLSALYVSFTLNFISPRGVAHRSIYLLSEGASLFLAGVSVLLYRGSNTLLLSAMSAGPVAVSTYAIAEKYVRMIQAVTFPLSQIFAVRTVATLSSKGGRGNIFSMLWQNTKVQICICFATIALFMALAETLRSQGVVQLSGDVMLLLAIMLGAVLFGIVNYMFGTIALSSLNKERLYAKIVASTGLLTVALSACLIVQFAAPGAAIGYISGELILSCLVLLALKRVS